MSDKEYIVDHIYSDGKQDYKCIGHFDNGDGKGLCVMEDSRMDYCNYYRLKKEYLQSVDGYKLVCISK